MTKTHAQPSIKEFRDHQGYTQDPEKLPEPARLEKPDDVNQFRLEAEENAAKMARLRLEHIAQERGVTVAQLLTPEGAPTLSEGDAARHAAVQNVLEEVEHVKESIRESEKAGHRGHAKH